MSTVSYDGVLTLCNLLKLTIELEGYESESFNCIMIELLSRHPELDPYLVAKYFEQVKIVLDISMY